jgi:hypothetical protein
MLDLTRETLLQAETFRLDQYFDEGSQSAVLLIIMLKGQLSQFHHHTA